MGKTFGYCSTDLPVRLGATLRESLLVFEREMEQ